MTRQDNTLTVKKHPQFLAILLRYGNFCALVATGTFVTLLAYPLLDSTASILSTYLGKFLPWFSWTTCLAISVGIWLALYSLKGWNPQHFSKGNALILSTLYPPGWLAGFSGAALFILLRQKSVVVPMRDIQPISILIVVLLVCTGGLVASSFILISKGARNAIVCRNIQMQEGTTAVRSQANQQEIRLLEWLNRNEPIEHDEEDFFGLSRVAQRIAVRLAEAKTVGVVGAYGSGKSSLRKLIQNRLEGSDIWSCVVEGWGFEPVGAPERVLQSIVDALSQHVDSVAIAGLPSQYTAALRATGSKFAGVAGELFPQAAVQSLKELDWILAAVNRKLVVFLEDVDRNDNPEVLESISSLLDRLRPLKRLTFVLEIQNSSGNTADLIRLCDYIEPLKPLSAAFVAEILEVFQACCFSASVRDVDLVGTSERAELIHKHDPYARIFANSYNSDLSPFVLSLASILDTPRKLKSAFRHVWFAWKYLHGEIDFQSLVAAMTIRIGAPEAWDFIVKRFDISRPPSGNVWNILPKEKREQRIKEHRDRERALFDLTTQSVSWDKDAVLALIDLLFRGFLDVPMITTKRAYQIPSETGPTDYWRRILTEAVEDKPSDQDFLRMLESWKQRTDRSSLVNAVLESHRAARMLAQFERQLDGGELIDLAEELLSESVNRLGRRTDIESFPVNEIVVNIVSKRSDVRRKDFARRQIRKAIKSSLLLSEDIAHRWGSIPDVASSAFHESRLWCYLATLCKRQVRSGAAWCNLLARGNLRNGYSLRILVRKERKSAELGRSSMPVAWWAWTIPYLLDAYAVDPGLMAPIIGALLAKSDNIGMERIGRYLVDYEFLSAFCPDPSVAKSFLNILLSEVDISGWDDDMQNITRQLRTTVQLP
jgi:hypothetical protein